MSYRITAVCLGNICRSPMAEAVLRSHLHDAGHLDVVVDSAGTGGWHVGEDADPRARRALARRGYHLDHSVRQFQPRWFDDGHELRADLVLAMDSDNLDDLRRITPGHVSPDLFRMTRSFDPVLAHLPEGHPGLDVPDPYYGGDAGFDDVLDMLEAAAVGLLDALPDLRAS